MRPPGRTRAPSMAADGPSAGDDAAAARPLFELELSKIVRDLGLVGWT